MWARRHGDEVVIVHVGEHGPVEVGRHALTTPGNPSVNDDYFPAQPEGALERTPRPKSPAEKAFLAIRLRRPLLADSPPGPLSVRQAFRALDRHVADYIAGARMAA